MIPLRAIVAITPSYGIGQSGYLPWNFQGLTFSKDIKHFKNITCQTTSPTKQNAVIMGKNTWLSLPRHSVPLAGRCNVVLTRDVEWAEEHLRPFGVLHATSLEHALQLLHNEPYKGFIESAIVIGGAKLFEETILHPQFTEIYVTEIDKDFPCDTFLSYITVAKLLSLQQVDILCEETEHNIPLRIKKYSSL